MSGPATKMREACHAAVEKITVCWGDGPEHGVIRIQCADAVRDLTPAQLEAMDAAAEAISGPAPETNYREGLTGDLLLHAESGGRWARIVVSEHEEERLLRVLLERRIQRRSAPPTTPDSSSRS